ncbi:Hypothetical predicted protein [Marmota monax]|uniref:Nuclear protein 2, transcriptional regulator n=2 Tax=Marmota monax TaxID=9995 RepID=A0A5E4ACK3_MARMO|nr:Hypothetical predicted protein [Marmota monax]
MLRGVRQPTFSSPQRLSPGCHHRRPGQHLRGSMTSAKLHPGHAPTGGANGSARRATCPFAPPLRRSQSEGRAAPPSRGPRGLAPPRRGAMDPGLDPARLRVRRARPPPAEAKLPVNYEEELYDCLDYHYLRDFPASGAGRSKGRTRREQELRTNRPVPGGHERKVAQRLLNGQRKRRQRQLQPLPRTCLA